MKKLSLVVLAALLLPAAAEAQVVGGVRVGYAWGLGNVAKDGDTMQQTLKGQIPIQADLGVKLMPQLTLGAYGAYGPARIGSFCAPGASCSGYDIDAGIQAMWRFTLTDVSPWAGVGVGYEWAEYQSTLDGDKLEAKGRGWETPRVEAGLDFILGGKVAVGPFAQWTLGRYDYLWESAPGAITNGTTPASAIWHSWITVGLRGTFDPVDDGGAAARRADAARRQQEEEQVALAAKAHEEANAKAAAEAQAAAAAQAAAEKEAAAKRAAPASTEAAKSRVEVEKRLLDIRAGIRFETGKDRIRKDSESTLRNVADILRAHPEAMTVVIEGHTDTVGKPAVNKILSEKRAAAVKRWLVEKGGIDEKRLDAVGLGDAQPIADNKTAKGRAANRRVDFVVKE